MAQSIVSEDQACGGVPSAEMVFKFNQCIDCEREWSTKDVKAGKWYKVQDWEVERWVCYRCTARMWNKAGSAITHCDEHIDCHLLKGEFKNGMQKCFVYHKNIHPPTLCM